MNILERAKKYIPEDEEILASIHKNPFWSNYEALYIATENRIGILEHKGLFKWSFVSTGWEDIVRVAIEESFFNCAVRIITKLPHPDKEGETLIEIIKDVDKNDARHFVSVATKLIENNLERMAYRTKRCPLCDEIVKWNAKICKYCGYEF